MSNYPAAITPEEAIKTYKPAESVVAHVNSSLSAQWSLPEIRSGRYIYVYIEHHVMEETSFFLREYYGAAGWEVTTRVTADGCLELHFSKA